VSRALLWVVCLAACAVPDLDRKGAIRCGVETERNGGCPDDYTCNADRCCPVGAPGCPTLPNACEGHRVAPYPASTPPAECASPGVAGRPCARLLDCGGGMLCTTTVGSVTIPGGYCTTLGCTGPSRSACEAGGGVCTALAGSALSNACLMRCSLPAGETFGRCRDDQPGKYICARITNTQINETLCIPDCESTPAICTGGSRCDLRTHRCVGGS
jgi:hypothetical protein